MHIYVLATLLTASMRDIDNVFGCLCAGTLLVNERMLESYIIARDRFLVPNGKMFPSRGR